MANTIGTAYIQIEPTTKGISGSISNILDNEASQAGTSAGNKLSSALGSAAKVGVTAIAGATAAVGAFGKASIDAGQVFDSSMSQVAATMGYSTAELADSTSEASQNFQKLRDFAQEMGSKTAFSASEAADALNYMALAGYDAETSMQMLPNVLNLAAAGGIDLASASDMVTDAQSALGLSLEETGVMVDQMAMASSKSNTSVAQLGEAFLTIGANAKSLSGGTQELSTALGILADNGIKGAEGGTHLRNIMMSLNPTTDAAASAWERLGVSAYDTATGALRPLEDTFADLNEAMEGMTDQEKTDILSKMFNKTDLASVNALLATQSERWDELSGAIGEASGSAQNMAEVQLDNLSGDITLFQSALEGTKIALSDALTPALRDFVQIGSEGLSAITTAFKSGGLEGAMDALGDTLTKLVEKVTSMLPEMVNAGMSLLKSVGDGILQNLPEIIKAGLEIVLELANGLAESLPELIPTIVDVVLEITDTLIDNVDLLIDGAIALIVGLAEGLINALPRLIEKIPEIVIKIGDAVIRNAPKLVKAAIELILTLQKGLLDNIPKLIQAVPKLIEAMKDQFIARLEAMVQIGSDLVDGIKRGISQAWEHLLSWLGDLCGGLVDKVKSALKIGSPSKLFRDEVGKWIPEGVAVGIDANVDSIDDSMLNMQSRLDPNKLVTASSELELDGQANSSNINTESISEAVTSAIIEAMRGMGIYMDSKQVGYMVASSVDARLGQLAVRRV